MIIKYLNGEKVCVVEDTLNKTITAYNYKDVVNALNRIFKEAEISESKINEFGDSMSVVLTMIAGMYNLQGKRISTRENKVIFDDEKIINKRKYSPLLKLKRQNTLLTVIQGGIN